MGLESKKTLIFRIYQILEEYSNEKHPLTQQDIIDILLRDYGVECERKAVSRNISYLKEIGFDIESNKLGSYLATRQLEDSELRLLIDSVLGSRHINPTHSGQLIGKLIKIGGKYFKSHVKHVHSVNDWEKTSNKDFFLNVEIVDDAIEQGRKIKFDYNRIGLDKKLHVTEKHVASPYQMVLHNQRYYVMLKDDKRDNMSFYRLDKITNMEIINEVCTPLKSVKGYEKGINYRAISTSMPYMYNDEQKFVTLKCLNFMTDEICDWFGYDVVFKKLDEEHFSVTVKSSERAMLYWVLQYNTNVEVLAPESLRQQVKDTLKASLAQYE